MNGTRRDERWDGGLEEKTTEDGCSGQTLEVKPETDPTTASEHLNPAKMTGQDPPSAVADAPLTANAWIKSGSLMQH